MCGCFSGDQAHTQACALTGKRTSAPLISRSALSPLSHTSQGHNGFFIYAHQVLHEYLQEHIKLNYIFKLYSI